MVESMMQPSIKINVPHESYEFKKDFDEIKNKITNTGNKDINDIPLTEKDKNTGVSKINISYFEKDNNGKMTINKSYQDGGSSSYGISFKKNNDEEKGDIYTFTLLGSKSDNKGVITQNDETPIDNENDLKEFLKPFNERIQSVETQIKKTKIEKITELANADVGDPEKELEQKLLTV